MLHHRGRYRLSLWVVVVVVEEEEVFVRLMLPFLVSCLVDQWVNSQALLSGAGRCDDGAWTN